ncbi:MAG: PIN domain nuclease [Proteobacteria bacterium]|nr:PIN domain nuclease [Pseudomonadota bacterium]
MIVVDTSAWGAFFNGDASPITDRLAAALETAEPIAIAPVIVTETLQGFKSDAGFKGALALLSRLPILEPSFDTHVRAAQLFRSLRRKGVTIRGTIDCLIAAACIDSNAGLLTLDVDFDRIAEHSALGLVRF